jgi:hypothetical protein
LMSNRISSSERRAYSRAKSTSITVTVYRPTT